MTDTHCHLNHHSFSPDLDKVIRRARDAGISGMVVIGYDLPSSEAAIEIAEQHSGVWATVGIHPHDASQCSHSAMAAIRELAQHPKVVAIGETGLDFYYNHSSRESQFSALEQHLELAVEQQLPVVFHCRDAYSELLARVRTCRGLRGIVFHCWDGSVQETESAVELGAYFGIGGMVTFRKLNNMQLALPHIPRDRLLLETDAPYLAPVPMRGRRNEPAFLPHVATTVAQLLDLSPSDVEKVTDANAARLFGGWNAAAES